MDISIDIVELPHKGVKLYCEDNGKPLPQRSWSTLACLVDGNLGDYWQDGSEMGTEEVISNSSRIDEIEVDEDDRERNPDVSSRKEGRTIGVPQENASIHYNSSPSDKNQAKKKLRVAIPSEGVRVAFCSELQKATFYKFPESAFTFIISCMNC